MTYDPDNEKHRERNRNYQKEWYKKNKVLHKERVAKNNKRYLKEIREYIKEYKKQGCSLCPEKHPACIEFHHLNPTEKELNIASAVSKKWSFKRLQKEIQKCVLLCANCHRKLHYDRRGFG